MLFQEALYLFVHPKGLAAAFIALSHLVVLVLATKNIFKLYENLFLFALSLMELRILNM